MNCYDCRLIKGNTTRAQFHIVLEGPALTHDHMHSMPGVTERWDMFLCTPCTSMLNSEPLGPDVRLVHIHSL